MPIGNMIHVRHYIVKETDGLIRCPRRYSFSDLKETANVLAYGLPLSWKRRNDSHGLITRFKQSGAFVMVGLTGIAG